MTSLKNLIANNMKEQRRILGISQAVLAELVDTSANYIAMIELGRKTASLPMLERIAAALQIDPSELFSMQSIPTKSLKEIQKTVLIDIEKAVNEVIHERIKSMEDNAEI
jgi:transcriptional regulator with XRE-family HTH domain